jgi:hypothetical protein
MSQTDDKGDGSTLYRMRKAVTSTRTTRKQKIEQSMRKRVRNRLPNELYSLLETYSERVGNPTANGEMIMRWGPFVRQKERLHYFVRRKDRLHYFVRRKERLHYSVRRKERLHYFWDTDVVTA